MSTPHVGNFVSDLVEMAKAMEELPAVKAALQGETEHANRLAQTVVERDETIARFKTELEALAEKVRRTEAERDDAELRFLELDEKAHKALAALGDLSASLADAKTVLEPPKAAEPTPEPVIPAWTPEPVATHPSATTYTDGTTYVPPSPAPAVAAVDPQSPVTAGPTVESGSGTPQADVGSGGTSSPALPTQAPSAPTGTGTDHVASSWAGSSHSESSTTSGQGESQPSSADPEPTKHMPGTTTVSQAWWDWYDRQSIEFRQAYKFD